MNRLLISKHFHIFSTGIKSVAFFFSAISTQGPKKQPSKKGGGGNDEHVHGAESGDDDLITPSQVSSSASQTWVSEHPSIINGKLRPSLSYWVAVTTPNGAPANPITFHRALLECGVEATANQVNVYNNSLNLLKIILCYYFYVKSLENNRKV